MNIKIVTMAGTNLFLSNVISVEHIRAGIKVETNDNEFFFPFANIEYTQKRKAGE
jgi:hypothetical protein